VVSIKEDEDFNQVSRLLKTSKYIQKLDDMRGLAQWVFDRNLVPMEQEEHDYWIKRKSLPVDIRRVNVI
jgi:hypothetical protein